MSRKPGEIEWMEELPGAAEAKSCSGTFRERTRREHERE